MPRLRMLLPLTLAMQAAVLAASHLDPFDIFRPAIVLRPAERRALDRGTPVLTLPRAGGRQLAVFSAIGIDSRDDRHRARGWIRRTEQLRNNPNVIATGRFSTPLAATDLGAATLDDRDLEDIRTCRPGHCNVKLTAAEILELQRTIAGAGTDWRNAVQRGFRAIVLRRVAAYLRGSHAALDDNADHRVPRSPSAAFSSIAANTSVLEQIAPGILDEAARCPAAFIGPHQGFIYWSKELLGGKTIVSATHVLLVEPDAGSPVETFAIAIQIFATHYLDASLEIFAVVRNADWSRRYLVHVHRSEVDLLDGFWGGVARAAITSRIKSDGPAILEAARRRLTTVDPPSP